MPDLWMPGAARHSLGNTGVMDGGPARAVWHITSNEHDWTFKNELGWFTGGGASVAPHLLWDPFTGEITQFFPADSRSLSLQNAGDVRTNRTGKYCIQIETVFTAGETVGGRTYATVRDTPCKGLPGIVTWLRSLGIADGWPGGVPSAFARDTVSIDMWTRLGGHYGHNQIPGNSHVDPGPMPNLFIAIPSEEDDMPTTAEIANAVFAKFAAGGGVLENSDVDRMAAAVAAKLQPIEAAQTAAITALAGQLGKNVDTAAVVAAVQKAIADAVVKVSVDVTGPGTP